MWDTIRESSIGQLLRRTGRSHAALSYPEELESFEVPRRFRSQRITPCPPDEDEDEGPGAQRSPWSADASWDTCQAMDIDVAAEAGYQMEEKSIYPETTKPHLKDSSAERGGRHQAATATVLVDWYPDEDPSNPRNWSLGKKLWVTLQMGVYTFAVYLGSSLYAPSQGQVRLHFGTSATVAELGIALYVVGYGVGPLLWSPLSEIPRLGRSPIYVATFFVFGWLALGAALVDDPAGLLCLRFLLGFFGSPCLATAGATLADVFPPWKLPYVLTVWSAASTLGPAFGPVVSGFAVSGMGWRYWELFWITVPAWLLIFFGLPETSADAILHRRAARLRRRTGRAELRCEAEMDHEHLSARQVVTGALVKPWEINALDPAVLFTTIYCALLYMTYYSFFEAFPLVFTDMYGFGLGEAGLPFLSFVPAIVIGFGGYVIWFRLRIEKGAPPLYGSPEYKLLPAVVTTLLAPIGLFVFAWTSRPDIHWMVPISGLLFFEICILVVFQCLFFYISQSYPRYAASLFAANDFARSSFAAASVLFSNPMYQRLGIAGGVSLLGGLSLACAGGMLYLYLQGHKLRARSRFARSSSEI
ncbi:MFS general substrate transporter [Xylariomycetidae sp. FL2044]|nr:MFS general substrate transporter [Xylariomycetidae sp. FL2044]